MPVGDSPPALCASVRHANACARYAWIERVDPGHLKSVLIQEWLLASLTTPSLAWGHCGFSGAAASEGGSAFFSTGAASAGGVASSGGFTAGAGLDR